MPSHREAGSSGGTAPARAARCEPCRGSGRDSSGRRAASSSTAEPYAGSRAAKQQMLAISRGLMARPICLLLDEPSPELAPRVVESLFEVIADLATGGLTILLVEQLASVALTVADRAYVLESGRLVTDGPAEEVANDRRVVQAYLGA